MTMRETASVEESDSHSRSKRIAWLVVAVFFAVGIGLAYPLATGFMGLTVARFTPRSDSREAHWFTFTDRFKDGQVMYNSYYLLISAVDPQEQLVTPCRQLVLEEYLALFAIAGALYGKLVCLSSFFSTSCKFPSVPSSAYIARNGSQVLVSVNLLFGPNPPEENYFVETFPLQDLFDNSSCPLQVTVQQTGLLDMTDALKTSAIDDLEVIDSFSLPLAFAFAAACTRSIRSIFVTFSMLLLTIIIVFALMNPVAQYMSVSTVTPEIIIAVCAALCIDYSLFLLTRFAEVRDLELERLRRSHSRVVINNSTTTESLFHDPLPPLSEQNCDVPCDEHGRPFDQMASVRLHIVQQMLLSCLTNIFFSASTITGVYVCLLFSSSDLVKCMAIACSLSATVCAIVALVFAPCLIFSCYGFLTRRAPWLEQVENAWEACKTRAWSLVCRSETTQDDLRSDIDGRPTTETASLLSKNTLSFEERRIASQSRSPWFRIAYFATEYPAFTLIACGFLVLPFALVLIPWNKTDKPGFNVAFNIFEEVPTNAPSVILYKDLFSSASGFSTTLSPPFYLLFDFDCEGRNDSVPPASHVVEWQYKAMDDIAQRIIADNFPYFAQVIAPTRNATGGFVPFSDVPDCSLWNSTEYDSFYCQQWRMLMNGANIQTANAGLIAFLTTKNSLAEIGDDCMTYLDNLLGDLQPKYSNKFLVGLYGSDLDSYGSMREVYDTIWYCLGGAACLIVVAMFLAFRSLLLAVRLVVTIAFTLIIAFGVATLVFCYTFSHGNGPLEVSVLVGVSSLQWVIPMIAAPFIAALAVDYDAFILSRVLRLRKAGFSTRAAVVKSVRATGRVITYAAVIMTIAFGSLVLSHSVMLQQFGTLLLVAVIADSVIVRTMFVPALMMIFPKLLWWPATIEEGHLGVRDTSLNE